MLVNSVEKTLSNFSIFSPGPWVDNTEEESPSLKLESVLCLFVLVGGRRGNRSHIRNSIRDQTIVSMADSGYNRRVRGEDRFCESLGVERLEVRIAPATTANDDLYC